MSTDCGPTCNIIFNASLLLFRCEIRDKIDNPRLVSVWDTITRLMHEMSLPSGVKKGSVRISLKIASIIWLAYNNIYVSATSDAPIPTKLKYWVTK
jgi:hypothetical protein